MLVETIKLKNGQILEIHQDNDSPNPREDWDNAGKMVCFHKRYDLGDSHNISPDNFENFEDMVHNTIENGVYLPIYMYDHSGITIRTTPFDCRWDSGLLGFIYMTAQDIRREFGNANEESRDKALKLLKSEVKTYDTYLRGDVYGFVLYEVVTCNLGHEHKEEIDSCWGFFGSDHEESGLFEHAGIKKENVA